MKRISFQLVGLVRGFRFQETRDDIYNLILKPLEEQGFEVDIFVHTYDKEYDNIIEKLDKENFNIKEIQIDLDFEIEKYLKEKINIEKTYSWYPHWTYHNKFGWFKYYNSIKKCNDLRKKYQKEKNIEYDWVIVSSPQMKPTIQIDNFNQMVNNYIYSPDYARFGGYYDSFVVGNQDHIDYLSTLYEEMISDRKHEKINPEIILKKFIDQKYEVKWLKIRFNRIRYDGSVVDH